MALAPTVAICAKLLPSVERSTAKPSSSLLLSLQLRLIWLIEAASSYYIGIYWTPVALFTVLIVILLVRPNGLLGRSA